jgi:transcriptional regulator with XRE-family HTH domain
MRERRGALRAANRQEQELLLGLLRAIREERGLHQTELAKALGRPQSYVSKYEAGARRLDVLEVKHVCDAVGIDLIEFVRRFRDLLNAAESASKSHTRVTPKPRT